MSDEGKKYAGHETLNTREWTPEEQKAVDEYLAEIEKIRARMDAIRLLTSPDKTEEPK